ncbi:MAG TPA: hypothetical protein VGB54_14460 [Allosphingosinicella sp.]|jgi:hypothetical protein
MAEAARSGGTDVPQPEIEHNEYHSAVEVDENYANWRDWVGPALAALFALAAIIVVVLMLTEQL